LEREETMPWGAGERRGERGERREIWLIYF
jgi:hypothetical protein